MGKLNKGEVERMTAIGYGIGYSLPNDEDYALAKLGPALDEAAALGVDYAELALYGLELVANGRVLNDRVKRVKALTTGRPFGLTIHGPLSLNLMDATERGQMHKAVLKAHLEIAAELGGVHFVAHAGRYVAGESGEPEASCARQRDALAEAGDYAQAHGIVIAVENLFGSHGGRETLLPSRLAAEIAAIGHPAIRACLDFSHGYLEATRQGVDFVTEAAALAPFAKHLHIHDSFGTLWQAQPNHRAERLAYGLGDLHLPVGLGSIPWDALMERCNFPKDVIFIHELAPPYWADLAVSVERTRALAARAKIGMPAN
jgi:sugar phosphate isomerase/epimerase